MTDYIKRQDAYNSCDSIASDYHERRRFDEEYVASECADAIELLPSAPVREVVKGEWLPDTMCYYEERFVCSKCKGNYKVDTCMGKPIWNFCPNCGADMRKEPT